MRCSSAATAPSRENSSATIPPFAASRVSSSAYSAGDSATPSERKCTVRSSVSFMRRFRTFANSWNYVADASNRRDARGRPWPAEPGIDWIFPIAIFADVLCLCLQGAQAGMPRLRRRRSLPLRRQNRRRQIARSAPAAPNPPARRTGGTAAAPGCGTSRKIPQHACAASNVMCRRIAPGSVLPVPPVLSVEIRSQPPLQSQISHTADDPSTEAITTIT